MSAAKVQLMSEIDSAALAALLQLYGLETQILPLDAEIPGSFWGAPEAGLVGDVLYIRPDTPVHSALHEASHWICMDDKRRKNLHTDAGGTVQEECAVNYLQILLAERLPDVGREQMMQDMTAWEYSYREGSVYAWIAGDGKEALQWLNDYGLAEGEQLTFKKR